MFNICRAVSKIRVCHLFIDEFTSLLIFYFFCITIKTHLPHPKKIYTVFFVFSILYGYLCCPLLVVHGGRSQNDLK